MGKSTQPPPPPPPLPRPHLARLSGLAGDSGFGQNRTQNVCDPHLPPSPQKKRVNMPMPLSVTKGILRETEWDAAWIPHSWRLRGLPGCYGGHTTLIRGTYCNGRLPWSRTPQQPRRDPVITTPFLSRNLTWLLRTALREGVTTVF